MSPESSSPERPEAEEAPRTEELAAGTPPTANLVTDAADHAESTAVLGLEPQEPADPAPREPADLELEEPAELEPQEATDPEPLSTAITPAPVAPPAADEPTAPAAPPTADAPPRADTPPAAVAPPAPVAAPASVASSPDAPPEPTGWAARGVRMRTVVLGLVLLAVSVTSLLRVLTDVHVDDSLVALVLLVVAGALLLGGGVASAAREARAGRARR